MYFINKTHYGILRYLHRTLGSRYFQNINISTDQNYFKDPKTVFDFNDYTYWIADNYVPDGNYLSFCLPRYLVKITGYEITAGIYADNGTPYRWGFSAGNSTENEVIEEYNMKQGETHYVKYEKEGYYSCFRYINRGFIEKKDGVIQGYRSRVAHIELFGYLYIDECKLSYIKHRTFNINIFTFILITLS